ncbi:hypothetical protein HGT70_14680 [Rosenbergiella collisarenosi]|uniref:hypothetical protein n=1 Tax=Rosenbergiella collisarenosi TaxID=1544695 RepID=UPI001BDB5249|nr:hypothetical protein [Rosenbergiella collisarenosi]MBT0722513.1 hypothetical protein [Rosenbergiella collisarenosi]
MNKTPLSEESFTHLTKSVSETDHDFRCALTDWFCHYQNEFMAATDLYLYRNENEHIFSSLLSQIMYSPLFSYSIKIKLYKYYEEYYFNNHEGEINPPQDIKISVFSESHSQEMKIRLMTSLINENFHDKKILAGMAENMSENELKKIFTQRTAATLTLIDRDLCIPLLDTLQKAALIRDYELRDDKKVFVTIQRSVSKNKK